MTDDTPTDSAPGPTDQVASDYEPFTRRHGRLLIILVIGAMMIGVAIMQRKRMSYHEGTAHRLVGKKLTGLRLQPWDDKSAEITDEALRGRIVLIHFWGTWCPPCRLEMPHTVELYEQFRTESKFRLLAVSCRGAPGQSRDSLRKETSQYLATLPSRPPVCFDEDQATRRRLVELGIEEFVYPTTVVLDQTGTIRGLWEGYAPGIENLQRSLIRSLLREVQSTSP